MAGAARKTLISVLRVLAVLVALGGAAYLWMSLTYDDEQPRVQANEGPAAVQDAMVSVQMFYQEHQRFPGSGELPVKIRPERHVKSATLGNAGMFTIEYQGRREIDGKTLFLTPYFDKIGMLQWKCLLPEIDPRWWPDFCRTQPAP